MSKTVQGYGELFQGYPDVVGVDGLCDMLGGISKKMAYRLLADGQIRSVKIGRSYKIPKVFVTEYLLEQSTDMGWISSQPCGSVGAADGRPPNADGMLCGENPAMAGAHSS